MQRDQRNAVTSLSLPPVSVRSWLTTPKAKAKSENKQVRYGTFASVGLDQFRFQQFITGMPTAKHVRVQAEKRPPTAWSKSLSFSSLIRKEGDS